MNVPTHIALIMDGNRRWAKSKGLLSIEGHRRAATTVLPQLIKKAAELGIQYLTFWAMSTENFQKRSKWELNGLFTLMKVVYRLKIKEIQKNEIKIKIIGNISKFPQDIQDLIARVVKETANNTKGTLIFALNYGGRDEIIRAIDQMQKSKFKDQSLTEEDFAKYLDTAGVPDPDLIIRTGGEKRLSGFLPWQGVYSELYFTDLYFPDFDEKELMRAIADFQQRKRRYGK